MSMSAAYSAGSVKPERSALSRQNVPCDICKAPGSAVVRIGGAFCSACFVLSCRRRFVETMARACAVRKYDRLVLGYSGGAGSSMVLSLMLSGNSIPLDPLPALRALSRGLPVAPTTSADAPANAAAVAAGTSAPYLWTADLPVGDAPTHSPFRPAFRVGVDGASSVDTMRADVITLRNNDHVSNRLPGSFPLRFLPVFVDDSVAHSAAARGGQPPALTCLNGWGEDDTSLVDEPTRELLQPTFFPGPSTAGSSTTAATTDSSPLVVRSPCGLAVRLARTQVLQPRDGRDARRAAGAAGAAGRRKVAAAAAAAVDASAAVDAAAASVGAAAASAPESAGQGDGEGARQLPLYIPVLSVPLEWADDESVDAFASVDGPQPSLDDRATAARARAKARRAALAAFLAGLPASGYNMVVRVLRLRVLSTVSALLGCGRVVIGDDAGRAADSAIERLIMGAGAAVPAGVAIVEPVYPLIRRSPAATTGMAAAAAIAPSTTATAVLLVRPLRDTLSKAVHTFLHLTGTCFAPRLPILRRGDDLAVRSLPLLASKFLAGLASTNEYVAYAVTRTCEKVAVRGSCITHPFDPRTRFVDGPWRGWREEKGAEGAEGAEGAAAAEAGTSAACAGRKCGWQQRSPVPAVSVAASSQSVDSGAAAAAAAGAVPHVPAVPAAIPAGTEAVSALTAATAGGSSIREHGSTAVDKRAVVDALRREHGRRVAAQYLLPEDAGVDGEGEATSTGGQAAMSAAGKGPFSESSLCAAGTGASCGCASSSSSVIPTASAAGGNHAVAVHGVDAAVEADKSTASAAAAPAPARAPKKRQLAAGEASLPTLAGVVAALVDGSSAPRCGFCRSERLRAPAGMRAELQAQAALKAIAIGVGMRPGAGSGGGNVDGGDAGYPEDAAAAAQEQARAAGAAIVDADDLWMHSRLCRACAKMFEKADRAALEAIIDWNALSVGTAPRFVVQDPALLAQR